jgi:4-hydroxy-3-polyprenylbenzoate decarboxylase
MKLVIAATGASGTLYLQRLLEQIDATANEVHLVMSSRAKQVAAEEVMSLKLRRWREHAENDLNVPFSAARPHRRDSHRSLFDVTQAGCASSTVARSSRPWWRPEERQADERAEAPEFDPRAACRAPRSRRDIFPPSRLFTAVPQSVDDVVDSRLAHRSNRFAQPALPQEKRGTAPVRSAGARWLVLWLLAGSRPRTAALDQGRSVVGAPPNERCISLSLAGSFSCPSSSSCCPAARRRVTARAAAACWRTGRPFQPKS